MSGRSWVMPQLAGRHFPPVHKHKHCLVSSHARNTVVATYLRLWQTPHECFGPKGIKEGLRLCAAYGVQESSRMACAGCILSLMGGAHRGHAVTV